LREHGVDPADLTAVALGAVHVGLRNPGQELDGVGVGDQRLDLLRRAALRRAR
jgi:hypothetical protein